MNSLQEIEARRYAILEEIRFIRSLKGGTIKGRITKRLCLFRLPVIVTSASLLIVKSRCTLHPK
ncbi:MAG: hypothetical protein KKH04_01520 [Proteobacteria bacterium]|nr:hypothetical protein [Pseudomonadota bacterium]